MSIPNDFGSNSLNQERLQEGRPDGSFDITQSIGPVQQIIGGPVQQPRPTQPRTIQPQRRDRS